MNGKWGWVVTLYLNQYCESKTSMHMDEKRMYTTPEVNVVNLKTEGMICASGNNWDTDDLPGFEFEDE